MEHWEKKLPLDSKHRPADAALSVLLVGDTLETLGEHGQLEVYTHHQILVVGVGHQGGLAEAKIRVDTGSVAGLRAVGRDQTLFIEHILQSCALNTFKFNSLQEVCVC